ncbi:intraflagellar transport protein 80 homolog [Culicoides brevitarsis]|uniref:intraflagellar transport protein 80 homolog n=1 Tax=Culicoides brevitarsis TaxID=469753 RepID=UPI00307BF97A
MKFKTYLSKEIKYKGTLSCIGWVSNEEVYSTTDDHQLYKWSASTRDAVQVAKLPDDFLPSDLHWLLRTAGGVKGNETLLIGSTDGRFIILNKSARVERSVSAHSGGITSCRWSPDGAGLLTAGEDGVIKIWSRSGMLRSTVLQNEGPIRCARWAPNSQAIVYCQGGAISVKALAANSKVVKWKAHEGVIYCLSYGSNELIASAGEDCRYKIWDAQGTNIFTSTQEDFAITSVEYNPDGDLLAVGGFNMLKLCHPTGWNYSNTRFIDESVGSIFSLTWSTDGTQVAAGSGVGHLVLGHIIEREAICKNLKATVKSRKTMILEDILTRTSDTLDFSERIIKWELGYGYLVVATIGQIQIFAEKYVNTPIIIDGKQDVRIIILGKKYFLVVDAASIWIYSYTGRLHLNPRFAGSQAQVPLLTKSCISLGLDYLAVRDSSDHAIIHVFDLLPGATRQDEPHVIKSKTAITELSVSRAGGSNEDQYLCYIDANRDLYIVAISSGPDFIVNKIGTQVISGMWCSNSNIFVGLHDACYSVWYCPGEASVDPTLIALTTVTYDTSEFGKNVTIESFEGSYITFRSSGAAFTIAIKPYFEALHRFVNDGMWKKSLQICRAFNHPVLWATLAAIASRQNEIEISEEAYSAAIQIDKVNYLQHIKALPKASPEQMAENSLMNGRTTEAEVILMNNRRIKEAVEFCIRMHRWEKALEIAQKSSDNELFEFVQNERRKYCAALSKEEWIPGFQTLNGGISSLAIQTDNF